MPEGCRVQGELRLPRRTLTAEEEEEEEEEEGRRPRPVAEEVAEAAEAMDLNNTNTG